MSKTFCPIPWIFQAVRNNGDIRICCQANVTDNRGVVRKDNNLSYNAGTDDMQEARNADLMKNVRKNMLNGVWSNECGRCQQEEENGLNSRRQYELENWKSFTYKDAEKITDSNGIINNFVKYYDLRFGNLCNLACRMCGPTDSHTWYDQWLEYHGGDSYDDTHGTVKLEKNKKGRWVTNDYNWHNSESFWQQIESNINNIEHVYMAGGEPLMIERHYEFLQKCIDSKHSHNITLEYNTNMTSLPDRVIEMWTKFKQVRVGASIDGFGDVIEYQRWPLKWKSAYENLQKLDYLASNNSNIIAWLAFTVTAYNIYHLPNFMWWKINDSKFKSINSTNRRPIITHHVAHGPKRLNIRMLPSHVKDDIRKVYTEHKNLFLESKLENYVKNNAVTILDGVKNYLNHDLNTKYFTEFVKFTKFLDKKRNQNILKIVPQYAQFF